jgi:S1-C subfamily serine protease
MNFKQLTAAFLVLGLAGCASSHSSAPAAGIAPGAGPATPLTSPVIFNQPTGKVAIAPVNIKLPERRGLGSYTRNVDCWVYVRPIRDSDFPSSEPMTDALRKALVGSKVDVLPGEALDVAAAQGADYLVTGSVPIAHADLCINDFFNADPADVDAQVTVAWQVWSVRENRVVFQTTTSGNGSAKSPEQVITPAVLIAMSDATEQLLQSATMQQYLTFGHMTVPQVTTPLPVAQGAAAVGAPVVAAAPTATGAPAPAAVVAAAPAAIDAGVAAPVLPRGVPILVSLPATGAADLKAGSVTVTSAQGKAAGFYVGQEGYIVTSAANLGGAVSVTVTNASGKNEVAQVVRRADEAGLALLKVANAPTAPLAIQPHRLAAGDKVTSFGAAGPVTGAVAGVAGRDGRLPVKLDGDLPGAAVVDTAGNIVGVSGGGSYLPIAAAFRALTLGVTLTER